MAKIIGHKITQVGEQKALHLYYESGKTKSFWLDENGNSAKCHGNISKAVKEYLIKNTEIQF